MTERILVIKLGALGDVIQALGPMRAIKDFHRGAHITVLTTKPFAAFLEKTGIFDEIWIDAKPKWWNPLGLLRFRKDFKERAFHRVYDLQNNDRTFLYFRLFWPQPEWVGAVPGASHRNADPDRSAGHAFYGHVQTLLIGGIDDIWPDDLSWMTGDIAGLNLPARYAVIAPGSAPQHLGKRWPHFGKLCKKLLEERQITPVIIGTKDEADTIAAIQEEAPGAVSLLGKTKLDDLPALARNAVCVIGNDTGPMHMMGPTGTKIIAIMGPLSNPKRHYPLGPQVTIIHDKKLDAISPDQVLAAMDKAT